MTVGDLIEMLSEYDDGAEVRIAHQPTWALEYSVSHAMSATEEEDVVYIAEGSQLGYLSIDITTDLISQGWV